MRQETHYVVLAGLELSTETRMALTHRDPRASACQVLGFTECASDGFGFVCEAKTARVSVHYVCAVPMAARRGRRIIWNWSYRQRELPCGC